MNKLNYALSGIGGYAVSLLGGADSQLEALLVVMCLDFVSGFLAALRGRSRKSESGYVSSGAAGAGILKKIAYLICVIVAVNAERSTGLSFIRQIVIVSFTVTESVSVLENCAGLGISIPAALYNALDALKRKNEDE